MGAERAAGQRRGLLHRAHARGHQPRALPDGVHVVGHEHEVAGADRPRAHRPRHAPGQLGAAVRRVDAQALLLGVRVRHHGQQVVAEHREHAHALGRGAGVGLGGGLVHLDEGVRGLRVVVAAAEGGDAAEGHLGAAAGHRHLVAHAQAPHLNLAPVAEVHPRRAGEALGGRGRQQQQRDGEERRRSRRHQRSAAPSHPPLLPLLLLLPLLPLSVRPYLPSSPRTVRACFPGGGETPAITRARASFGTNHPGCRLCLHP